MPRPRPQRTEQEQSNTIANAEQKSRQKAESARKRTAAQTPEAPDGWPLNGGGRPLAKVTMTASELIPNGQFANVSIGPAQITVFVDIERVLEKDDEGNTLPYFSDQEVETLAAATNEIAEIVEIDVIGVQRNLVLESIQDQVAQGNANGGK